MTSPADSSSSTSAAEAPRFAGKVALITGARDRGIGGEIALRLAREGASVAMISRHESDRLLKKLGKLKGGVLHTLGDITKGDDVARLVDDCLKQFGRLDIVVNNAGVEQAKSLDKFTDA